VKEVAISQFPRRDKKRQLMGYSMRTDKFRYVEWINRRTRKAIAYELYDHVNDPGEMVNLATQSDQKESLEKLSKQLWETLPEPPPFAEKKR